MQTVSNPCVRRFLATAESVRLDHDVAVLSVEDAEFLARLVQDALYGKRVLQRHDHALGAAGAYAVGHLNELVGVAGAERWAVDRLRLLASAMQHDAMRMVEPRRHLDPALGALDPRCPRRVMLQRYQERRDPAVVIAQQQPGLGITPVGASDPLTAMRSGVPRKYCAKDTT